jgi:cobalt-precorrin 5A hydrolase
MEGHAVIVAGFGFRAAASAESLAEAFRRAGGNATSLATVADKADTPGFRAFATTVALPVTRVDPGTLTEQRTTTRSRGSENARGTGSVAEAAALAAAGPGARLLAPRRISADRMATCALAVPGCGTPEALREAEKTGDEND